MFRIRKNISTYLPSFAALSLSLVLMSLIAGCGTTVSTAHESAAAAPTVSVVASSMSIAPKGSSVLSVSAANAATVTLTGSDGTSYTMAGTGGKQAVTPASTTTYTALASGPGGKATATIAITVSSGVPPPPPPNPALTVTIQASPSAIAPSGSSTLTVASSNATQVAIVGSDGSTYLLPGNGTQIVSPAATTTYTATASGPGGQATGTAVVTVTSNPAPVLTIQANPSAITASSSSVLTIIAANATQVMLSGSDGTSQALSVSGGTQAVSPKVTTTYTVTAMGPGGTAKPAAATVTVSPNPAPTVNLAATPASITVGGSSTLSVTTANANQVTIAGSDGSSYPLTASSGQQVVSPSTTTTYTATAMGAGGQALSAATVAVTAVPTPSASISASPSSVVSGHSTTLNVTATNASQVTVTGDDGSSYTLSATGGPHTVEPTKKTTYKVVVTGQSGGTATASVTVDVTSAGSVQAVDHVIFMLQENHSFDNYFGMLNPYRAANGWTKGEDGTSYTVDGIDDKLTTTSNQNDDGTSFGLFKLTSTCVDDETSAWLESYGQVNRYDFSAQRAIKMDGFVHTAQGFANSCTTGGAVCSGTFTDKTGQRAMGYYDQDFLNYYYYMASQFAISDRWFTPVSGKSRPNRIASMTGGTTQGLVRDPGADDALPQLDINTIFQELETAQQTWKIYYSVTQGGCKDQDDCSANASAKYPATNFSYFSYANSFLYENPTGAACSGSTKPSSAVGDDTNSFCIDTNHIAPLSQYKVDVNSGTLPAFAFIEAGYGVDDEHPGSGQSVLMGQAQVADLVNTLMQSPSWKDSIFFLAYDEAGGPYDHVPPVPSHTNDFTSISLKDLTGDISTIAVNADSFNPCLPTPAGKATTHCDLIHYSSSFSDPGVNAGDAAAEQGFAAQLGFRVPNMVISPFTRKHYVSHTPMDHTAILKFVESRFIGPSAHLTNRDAKQPNLLDFFDFGATPWTAPPSPPSPFSDLSTCHASAFAPNQ